MTGGRPLLAGVHRRTDGVVVVVTCRQTITVAGDADLAEAVLGRCDGRHEVDDILAALPADDRPDAAALLDGLAASGGLVDAGQAWRIGHDQGSVGSALTPVIAPADLERLEASRTVPWHRSGGAHPLAPAPTRLAGLLGRRRSSEPADGPRAVTFPELSALLAAAYGPTRAGHAPVASAGGLYPLLFHVVAPRTLGPLRAGIWWHDHEEAVLRPVAVGCVDPAPLLVRQELTLELLRGGGPLVVISADVARPGRKYGSRAYRFALIEVGSAWQNLALTAAELGVPARAVGGIDDGAMVRTLGLGEVVPLLAVILGA